MDHLKFQNSQMSYPNPGRYVGQQNGNPPRPHQFTRPVPTVIPMKVRLWNNAQSINGVYSGGVSLANKISVQMRDSNSQTDFPKEIADLHLKELPNSLFINKNRFQTDSASSNDGISKTVDANKNHYVASGNNSVLKINLISSGTHPISHQNNYRDPLKESISYSMITKKPNPETQSSNNNNVNNSSEGEGIIAENTTKKKRKRNRKKKKQNTSENVESENTFLTVSEVNIRLEDEFEFPDLSGKKRTGVSISGNRLLDSNHAKTFNTHENIQDPLIINGSSEKENFDAIENMNFDNDLENNDHLLFKQAAETKTARKRRKRRDQANKAANDEMAEITIAQQMLQEMGLKAKKEIQPTKDPPTPTPKQAKTNKNNRKSNQPIALDFAAMIDALEQKRDDAIATKNAPKKTGIRKKPKPEVEPPRRPHNPLDSTCPKVKRGKEREFPKPKKPSPLKKVILKEREEKKRMRLLDEDPAVAGGGSQVYVGVVNPESDLSQEEERTKESVSAELSPVSQTSPFSMSPLSPGASPLHSGFNSPIAKDSGNPALLKIHSRRYREYCTQILDKDIDNCCLQFLQNLVRYQDKQYHKDPKKAKAKRRIVLGLREVAKHLKLEKIKCVIISPNLEKIQSKGGLDDALNNILNMCTEQEVPYVFALGRRALGRACAKLVPVSVVGVFNFEGSERQFWRLIELTQKATDSYKEMVSVVEKDLQENPNNRVGLSNVPILFAHMGHSRTPSGCSAISFTSSILSEPISENYPYSEPETDSKGYEVFKMGRGTFKDIQSSVISEQSSTYETDAGNEADTEDYLEPAETAKNQFSNSLEACDDEDEDDPDNIEDLPHIDSIHYGNYDLSVEILSQHSSRTIENSEIMSTHSSRTLRDGSPTMLLEKINEKHTLVGTVSTPHKVIDKDRIQSWVEATQSCTDDSRVDVSADENTVQEPEGNCDQNDVLSAVSIEKDDLINTSMNC